eukprot:XP_011672127.1 PREDICTED: uncharacterized protein LOC105442056 isoform X3 [Strongylocentrotus purpuratus]
MEPMDIAELVRGEVRDSQNTLLDKLETRVSDKLNHFQNDINDSQMAMSEVQLSKMEEITNTTYKFKKKGNEEQYKSNTKVYQKLSEAESLLKKDADLSRASTAAQNKIAEGKDILEHRQKIIKLADQSPFGWLTVSEYETNSLARDSDDEKRIWKAEARAKRKMNQAPRRKIASRNQIRPYPTDRQPASQQSSRPWSNPSSKTEGWDFKRKTGACFACGKFGHWRFECRELASSREARNEKISKNSFDIQLNDMKVHKRNAFADKNDSTESRLNSEKNCKVVTPVGRLKSAKDKWKEIGTNEFILDIISEGYKIPFITRPKKTESKNNRSAIQNAEFVGKEIQNLTRKGCVTEVFQKPEVINPLTVAGNKEKPRLVLDCRNINPHLFKQKVRYEGEDIAKEMIEEDDYMFTFDLKSAYHHVEIFREHRTYLGFSWDYEDQKRYFIFNVLPFGISTAGYIFTKLTRPVIAHWRSQGNNVIMYLDDGLVICKDRMSAITLSRQIREELKQLGFLIAEEKCNWNPTTRQTWLGLDWVTSENKVYISQRRVGKLKKNIENLLDRMQSNNDIVHVKELARVAGQISSMHTAMGQIVQIRTRNICNSLNTKASWQAPIKVGREAKDELKFWLHHVERINGIEIKRLPFVAYTMFTDASETGFGGFVAEKEDLELVGSWSNVEAVKSSTWRELEAMKRTLFSFERELKGQNVQLNTDNKNVVSILKKGSKKSELQEQAISIHNKCESSNITVDPVWIRRETNCKADNLSRRGDSDDWFITDEIFGYLDSKWGPYDIDRFANEYNAKCTKFNSRWWCSQTKSRSVWQAFP